MGKDIKTEGKWVLIVEDDVFINKAYEAKFKSEDVRVIFALDGEEALATLKESANLPMLVLLDLMLPKKNGFEVLEEIKADARTKKIPVVILTNLGQESDAKRALDLGAAEYMVRADTKIADIVEKAKSYLNT
ncbi:MAG: response regulator [Patescibacteria group bacterium]